MVRNALLLVAALAVMGCATARPEIDKEAVDDFVSVRGLEELDKIRTDQSAGFYELSEYDVIYQARREEYLFRFARRCWELNERRVTPDERRDGNTIRARFDTLRGCRIDKIYALTETEAEELRQLGEAPGSRN